MPQRDSCPVQIDAGGRKRTAVSVVFDHNPPRHLNRAHDTPRRVCVAYVSRSNAHRQAETKTPPAKAGGCLVWRRISGSDDRARDRLLPRRTCRQSPSRWCSITDIGALIVIRLSRVTDAGPEETALSHATHRSSPNTVSAKPYRRHALPVPGWVRRRWRSTTRALCTYSSGSPNFVCTRIHVVRNSS